MLRQDASSRSCSFKSLRRRQASHHGSSAVAWSVCVASLLLAVILALLRKQPKCATTQMRMHDPQHPPQVLVARVPTAFSYRQSPERHLAARAAAPDASALAAESAAAAFPVAAAAAPEPVPAAVPSGITLYYRTGWGGGSVHGSLNGGVWQDFPFTKVR